MVDWMPRIGLSLDESITRDAWKRITDEKWLEKDETTDCVYWTGPKRLRFLGRQMAIRRVFFHLFVQETEKGTCIVVHNPDIGTARAKLCVCPSHLRLITRNEIASITGCKRTRSP